MSENRGFKESRRGKGRELREGREDNTEDVACMLGSFSSQALVGLFLNY